MGSRRRRSQDAGDAVANLDRVLLPGGKPHADTDTHAHSDNYSNADGHACGNCNRNAHCVANSNSDADRDANSHSDCYSESYGQSKVTADSGAAAISCRACSSLCAKRNRGLSAFL